MSGRWVRVLPEEHAGPDENLAARVQEAKRLLDQGDEAELIAYLLRRPVADVRRVMPGGLERDL